MRKKSVNRFKNAEDVDISNHYYLVYKPLIRDLTFGINTYAKGKILDIGCGNKPYKEFFGGKFEEYLGCDITQSSENCVDIICEATDIPLESNLFDTIICTQVIEHVEDHNKLLSEIYRLLKPGGYIILSGPMYWHLHEEPFDFFRFTKHGLKHIFERQGFELVHTLANGGKWATFGQMVIHTFPQFLVRRKVFRKYSNMLFSYLDAKYYYDFNTMNYVVIAKK
ncbi:class I SAM-dependent methyltransferase [Flavobacterium algicola]|uniref:class I SAM-dependent methyltransferase n=1 Tax=Flavobacterium algicola TaxID=556529 RepID=UPI001EFDA31E|nr:class I SAM-dependent methyltransferase [Flavobacterium algicola]MCG9793909.1 class I SAM-dependent methyltransferase [Flavobacterium algicola]